MLQLTETASHIVAVGPKAEIGQLVDAFKYRPPEYWRADSYQIYKATDGERGWDGYLEPLKRTDKVRAPPGQSAAKVRRGYLKDLRDKASQLSIRLDESNLLLSPFQGLTVDDIPDQIITAPFQLDERQRQCVADWLRNVVGMNHVTVSGGKTAMFAAAAAMIKRRYPKARFLYFTQTERLCSQVMREVSKFLPSWDITQFGGGKRNETGIDMVVATGAMLNSHFDRLKKEKWFNSFMGLLIDEAHHAASPTWEKSILASSAFFRLGASDTTSEDNLVRWHKIRGLVGPILSTIESGVLIQAGRLAKPHIYLVDIGDWYNRFAGVQHAPAEDTEALVLMDGKWKKGLYAGPVHEHDPNSSDGWKRDRHGEKVKLDNYHQIIIDEIEYEVESRWCLLDRTRDRAIIRFNARNRLITEWAKYYSDKGMSTLVVCTPTLHILILKTLIGEAVGNELVRILYSDHDAKERDETFEWLKSTPGGVLISSLVKEGVSIPEIGGGVIADYVSGWEVARQLIGRFVRKKLTGENKAHITMFVERQHPRLIKHSLKLLDKLSKTRGFSFHHPVSHPDTIKSAVLFEDLS